MRFDSTLLSPTTFSTSKKGDRAESVEEENVRIPSRLSKRLRPTSLRKRFQYRDDLKGQLDEGPQRRNLHHKKVLLQEPQKTFHNELWVGYLEILLVKVSWEEEEAQYRERRDFLRERFREVFQYQWEICPLV